MKKKKSRKRTRIVFPYVVKELIDVVEDFYILRQERGLNSLFTEAIFKSIVNCILTLKERDTMYNASNIDILDYADVTPSKDFKALLGVKALRLISDIKGGKELKKDTLIDLINYCLFQLALMDLKKKECFSG